MLNFLFWVSIFTLIPGMLLRIGFGGAGVLPLDLLGLVFLSFWSFKTFLIQKTFPTWQPLVAGGVFLLWAGITWAFASPDLLLKDNILAFSYLLRFGFGLAVGAWAFSAFQKNKSNDIPQKIVILAFMLAIIGFLQFYFFPNLGSWSTEGAWDPHVGRLFGSWLDPNFLGGFLGLMLPVSVALFYTTKQKKWLFVFLCLLYALWLTFSRSGYLAAGVGLSFFFFFRQKAVILLGIVALGIGIASSERAQQRLGSLMGTFKAVLLQETDEIDPTASLRIESWRNSLELWQTSPIMGIGYNTYRAKAAEAGIVQEDHHNAGGSDSTLLTILVTTGLGLGFFLWFLWTLWWGAAGAWFTRQSVLHLGFASGLLSLFIHSFFVNSLLYPFIFIPMMAMAGALACQKAKGV